MEFFVHAVTYQRQHYNRGGDCCQLKYLHSMDLPTEYADPMVMVILSSLCSQLNHRYHHCQYLYHRLNCTVSCYNYIGVLIL